MDLSERYKSIQNRVIEACGRSDREPSSVTIVAVSKTFSRDDICKACALGITEIGENRVQEIVDKFADGEILRQFPPTRLHLIGHLQSNKVRKVVPLCATIDSIDSVTLARAIDTECATLGRRMRILLEVNTSGEPQKFGIRAADLYETIERLIPLGHLDLAGLMTVGPLTTDPRGIRQSFRILRESFEEMRALLNPPAWKVLSMGMSGDYEMAIEEGATEIRVGTALFGSRSAL